MLKQKTQDTKCGPKPEVLKINGNWRDAVKKTFDKKKKPANGWPK
jgi:hypothetical protein